jgi:hypothetical protein
VVAVAAAAAAAAAATPAVAGVGAIIFADLPFSFGYDAEAADVGSILA